MFDGNCQVIFAGTRLTGRTEVLLRPDGVTWDGTADNDRWFSSGPNVSREILATALAAIAANKVVYCNIETPNVDHAELSRFLIVR